MSNYRRANTAGGSYFFTVVSYRRQPLMCDEPFRNALRQAISRTREKHPFIVEAWVLLPDHCHAIWTLPEHDANFAKRWQLIKQYVTQQCKHLYFKPELMTTSKTKRQESTLWQRRYWEHEPSRVGNLLAHAFALSTHAQRRQHVAPISSAYHM